MAGPRALVLALAVAGAWADGAADGTAEDVPATRASLADAESDAAADEELRARRAAEAQFDQLMDDMIRTAEQAGALHKQQDMAGFDAAAVKIEKMYNEAVDLTTDALQAHLTYGQFLLNANRLDDALRVWRAAQAAITDDAAARNPGMKKYVAGRAHLCRYGKISQEKDRTYAGGSGDLHATLGLIDNQIRLKPLPQLYYDRATTRVMLSSIYKIYTRNAAQDFAENLERAMDGYFAARRMMGVKCDVDRSSLMQFPGAPLESEALDFRRTVHVDPKKGGSSGEVTKTVDTSYTSTKPFISTVKSAIVYGPDAVVTSTVCGGAQWTAPVLVEKLTEFYGAVGRRRPVEEVRGLLQHYGHDPGAFRKSLVETYKEKLAGVDTKWLDDWVSADAMGCACNVYIPSQAGRVNVARNIPQADVYGEFPEVDIQGSPKMTNAQPPQVRLRTAALAAQFAGTSFYHFVAEVLPRVAMVLLDPSLDSVPILVPSSPKFAGPLLRRLLDAVRTERPGVGTYEERYVNYAAVTEVDTLHVPTWIRDDMETRTTPPASIFQEVRRLLTKGLPGDPTEDRRAAIIYVPRRDTSMRQLAAANDAELVGSLATMAHELNMDFVEFHAKQHSLADTVSLFKRAHAVVGVHGGALSNIVYCKPGASVFELGFPTPFAADYIHMTSALALEHHYVQLVSSLQGMGASEVSVANMGVVTDALERVLATPGSMATHAADTGDDEDEGATATAAGDADEGGAGGATEDGRDGHANGRQQVPPPDSVAQGDSRREGAADVDGEHAVEETHEGAPDMHEDGNNVNAAAAHDNDDDDVDTASDALAHEGRAAGNTHENAAGADDMDYDVNNDEA